MVIGKAQKHRIPALWIEVDIPNKRNIICSVIYRSVIDHNSETFQEYFGQKLEHYNSKGKHVVIMVTFKIDLLKINQ